MSEPDGAVPENVLGALAANTAASETARRLADDSVAAMAEAGLLRLLVPKRAGGDERDLRAAASTIRACTTACSAAGWVLMVSTAHDWIIGAFPEAAQDEVWADGPDAVTPGSLSPSGALTPTADGFRVTGRWSFASGAAHGAWFLLCSVDRTGERPRLHHLVVPRGDLAFDDNWHTLGLRGTGSIDVLADDAFVPAHRAIDTGVLFTGRSEWAQHHQSPVYRTPIVPGLTTWLAVAGLGIADAAFAAAIDLLAVQEDRYTGQRKSQRPALHMRLAEARGEIACADALVDATLELLTQAAAHGTADAPLRARAKFQSAYAMTLCRRSLDRIMAAAGARAAFDASPLQRAFRDLTMAAKHEMVNIDSASEGYGRTLLGMDTVGFSM